MKYLKPAAAAAMGMAMATTPVLAGGMAEPVMEAEVVAEESSSSGDFVVPLLLLLFIAAIASSSDSGTVMEVPAS